MLRAERRYPSGRYASLAICVILGIALGIFHNRAAARNRSDPVTSSVRVLMLPPTMAASGISAWLGRQVGWLFRGRVADSENRRLRAENSRLREEIAALREAEITARRL